MQLACIYFKNWYFGKNTLFSALQSMRSKLSEKSREHEFREIKSQNSLQSWKYGHFSVCMVHKIIGYAAVSQSFHTHAIYSAVHGPYWPLQERQRQFSKHANNDFHVMNTSRCTFHIATVWQRFFYISHNKWFNLQKYSQ